MRSVFSRFGLRAVWLLCFMLLGALASCHGSSGGTVVVVALQLPAGATAPMDQEILQVDTSFDHTLPKSQQLQPPPLQFGLRAFTGFKGTFYVNVSLLDSSGCARLSAAGSAVISGQDAVDLTLPLTVNDCSDPDPPPAGSLPDVVTGGAPGDIRSYFGGASGGPAPQVLYPFDVTMTAPNINHMRVDWQGSQAYYRVQITAARNSLRLYSACDPACSVTISDTTWRAIALTNTSQTVTITVTGVSTMKGQVGVSSPVSVSISPQDLTGGLYYFSPSIRGVTRVPLGATQPVNFITNGNGTGCAGCHAISRDGKQAAVEFGSGNTAVGSGVVDAVNPQQMAWSLTPSISWNFAWFDPTGDQLVTNWQGDLVLRSSATGAVTTPIARSQINAPNGAAMPEWSPDGKWLTYVRLLQPSQTGADFELVNSGDIMIVPISAGVLGTPVMLVPGQVNQEIHFFPSWSPDSQWLVFNSLTCTAGVPCDTYNAAQTRLRLVRAVNSDGTAAAPNDPAPAAAMLPTPIELLRGTHQTGETTNWPKFSPFLQGPGLAFIVYNAKYPWGLQMGGTPQLFLFGVDLVKASLSDGSDPSYAPVWLPFQDQTTANHSAIWTTDVVCTQNSDCPVEFSCTGGVCVGTLG